MWGQVYVETYIVIQFTIFVISLLWSIYVSSNSFFQHFFSKLYTPSDLYFFSKFILISCYFLLFYNFYIVIHFNSIYVLSTLYFFVILLLFMFQFILQVFCSKIIITYYKLTRKTIFVILIKKSLFRSIIC